MKQYETYIYQTLVRIQLNRKVSPIRATLGYGREF